MRLRKGSFTEQQQLFIEAMVRTGDKAYAATQAGYGSLTRAYDQPPHVLAEIDRRGRAMMLGELIPMVWFRFSQALQDEATQLKDINVTAKILFAERARDGAGGLVKEPSEMTAEELSEAIAKTTLQQQALTRLAADRASPVLELEASPIAAEDSIFG